MAVLCFLIIVTVAGVDLGVKQYIEKHVKSNEERNILQKRGILRKVHNKGMIMNRLERYPLFVQLASVFALGIMMLWQAFLLKKPGCRMEKTGVALMLGGAVSNTYDRVKRRYVVDYLAIRTPHKKLTDITFNLADLAIVGGALVMLIGFLTSEKQSSF